MADEAVAQTTPVAEPAAAAPQTQDAGKAQSVPVAEESAASAAEGDNPKQDSKDSKADEDKADGAPEKYEPFTLPDGMEIDSEAMTEFQTIAKELNLSQEKAQKLVDLQTKREQATAEANQKAFENLVTGWLEDARNDKEIGGNKFDETVNVAKEAIEKFAPDAAKFRQMLSETGIGNHPEMIRYLAKVGEAISNDSIHLGRPGQSNTPKSAEQKLYPTMFPPDG